MCQHSQPSHPGLDPPWQNGVLTHHLFFIYKTSK
jgi:hypothetical protein